MGTLRHSLHGVRLAGLANTVRAIRYARRRDTLNARHAPAPVEENPRLPGSLLSVETLPSTTKFRFTNTELTVRFLRPDFLFIAWDGAEMTPSWAVARQDWPEVEVTTRSVGSVWRVSSPSLSLQVSSDGALAVLDGQGRLVREEAPCERRGRGWTQKVTLAPEACLYGLGERFASLNLRRTERAESHPALFRFWNRDPGGDYGRGDDTLYICMPVYLCAGDAGCHLAFHDNTFDGRLVVDGGLELGFVDGPCRTYIAVGRPSEVLERLTALTGRPPLPPVWALGYQHSRWGFRTEAELRRVFSGFRTRGLPLSALYLDIDHLRGCRTLTLDRGSHPDLPGLSRELADAGAHLVVSTDPGVKRDKGFDLYEQGLAEEAFCTLPGGEVFDGVVWAGWSAFPDFTNPRAGAWWGRQYERQLAAGIDGFWHDMNEPASFVSNGDPTFPLCVRHDMEGRGGDHREAHNVYGMLMNRAGYEGLRALRPERRPFILSRSGWVGMQRWSWSWTGDVETSWAALRRTLTCVLGLGLCGMPYTGPDIGGFSGAPSAELFTRWFQLASFLPFFRTHCANYLPRREPWSFGPEVLGFVKESLRIRYSLLPCWYTLAWQASITGAPLVRPLFWAEPERGDLREAADAFLLGDDLLVAPVLEQGVRKRDVLLPRGGWYEIDGEGACLKARQATLDAPLGRTPVLARAGSMVPMRDGDRLVLHAFRSGEGDAAEGRMYSDAGDGYGPHRIDSFRLVPDGQGAVRLLWGTEGSYPWPYASFTLRLHGFQGVHVAVESGMPMEIEMKT
jgi:alpha-glucosidase